MTRRGFIQAAGAAIGAAIGAPLAWGLGWREERADLSTPGVDVPEDLTDLVTDIDPREVPMLNLWHGPNPPEPNPFGVDDKFAAKVAEAYQKLNKQIQADIDRHLWEGRDLG